MSEFPAPVRLGHNDISGQWSVRHVGNTGDMQRLTQRPRRCHRSNKNYDVSSAAFTPPWRYRSCPSSPYWVSCRTIQKRRKAGPLPIYYRRGKKSRPVICETRRNMSCDLDEKNAPQRFCS